MNHLWMCRPSRFTMRLLVPFTLSPLAVLGTTLSQGPPVPKSPVALPAALNNVVFGGDKRPQHELSVGGRTCRAILNLGKTPALCWPIDPKQPVLRMDRAHIRTWLDKCDASLGLAGLQPRFVAESPWRASTVWEYELVYRDRVVLDARLHLYFDGNRRFAGMHSTFEVPTLGVDSPPAVVKPNERWVCVRVAAGYRMVLAQLQVRKTATHTITEVVTAKGTINTIYRADATPVVEAAKFTEWRVPGGFPDQIAADSTGRIWFSQPTLSRVASFDPATQKFLLYPTSPALEPDGLMIDGRDRVWTGMYRTGGLGMLDVPTKKFVAYPGPYGQPKMAIPDMSGHETVWITDHFRNRVSEFDPASKKWLGSYVIPTPAAWVVAGALDPGRDTMYFTESTANGLAVKELGQSLFEIADPNNGSPAFVEFHDDRVYFTGWSKSALVEYHVTTKKFTTYPLPIANERTGPMAIAANGDLVVGTRGVGYIAVFHPAAKSFSLYKIPTVNPGLKDGLTVSPDGAIWFTETFKAKIARLKR